MLPRRRRGAENALVFERLKRESAERATDETKRQMRNRSDAGKTLRLSVSAVIRDSRCEPGQTSVPEDPFLVGGARGATYGTEKA